MPSFYQSMTQTGILFMLTISSTSIFEKLVDINNSLRRIENQMKLQPKTLNEKID